MASRHLLVFLSLTLFIRPLICQNFNTNEHFISEFLAKMGLNPYKDANFTGSLCSWRGVFCDSNGENVVKLNFSGSNLSGAIPDTTIGKLIHLQTLDLSNNKITNLPSDFYSLVSLKSLNLSLNRISGVLPSNIGNFVELQSLDLSFNNFSGSIPDSISSLVRLQELNFSRNCFESVVPLGILKCTLLVSVDVSENRLTGTLPSGFGSAFPELKYLNLAGNRISGRGSDFVGMEMIKYLNVSGNLFKGSVVGFFQEQLEVLDLSRNQFQGHIDEVNFFNSSNLLYLDLSENQLSGEFFSNMNHALNLRHLNIAHNRFTKQQFLQVDNLTSLEYLNLSGTNMIGRIPSNMSHLTSLRTLDLSKNNLSYHIPSISTNNLRVLDLSYNELSGNIPLILLQELHLMERFNFSYNNLIFCSSQFSNDTLQAAFIGSVNSCPIAANPIFFRKKATKHSGLKFAAILTLSMICLVVGLLLLAFGCRRRTRLWAVKQNACHEEQIVPGPFSVQTDSNVVVADVKQAAYVPVVMFNKPLLNFTFGDLLSATSGFDRDTLLAEGKFGPVYGGILPGGISIAVKVLVNRFTMTDHEAASQFEYLGRIKHPNLVPLSGYCLAGEQRMAIYEYMENGNLENLLHNWSTENVESEGSLMSWTFRYKIALGVARALAFLHHGCSPPIFHRDLKASSVYLDSELEPRLSDFGLAKIFGNENGSGTPGYSPPEFIPQESSSPEVDATPNCDVYGFGVILFELITGKRPIEDENVEVKEGNLVSWVRALVRKSEGSQAIDPKISGLTGLDAQMVEALKIGYLCTAEIPSKRPSMQQVVGLLKDLDPIT